MHRCVRPGCRFVEPKRSGIIDDLREENPHRLAILSDHLQLLAKCLGSGMERERILRASTLQKAVLGPSHGSELGLEMSPKIREAQFQLRRSEAGLPRTVGHIPSLRACGSIHFTSLRDTTLTTNAGPSLVSRVHFQFVLVTHPEPNR